MFDAYLAVPYSHPDPAVRQERYDAVTALFDALTLAGLAVYSPISVNHHLADQMGADWQAWADIDRKALSACRCMVIYRLDGWKESEGIRHEMALCQEMRKDIFFHSKDNHIGPVLLIAAIRTISSPA